MKNKIKLYHFTDKQIKDKISTKNFGDNIYTFNDSKISKVKRAFYYLGIDNIEDRFKHSKYLYVTEINPKNLYNLTEDKKGYIKKYRDLDLLLKKLKSQYSGITYNIGISDIAVVFRDLKIKDKITRR